MYDMSKGKGWYGEPGRHALAARGVETSDKMLKSKVQMAKKYGDVLDIDVDDEKMQVILEQELDAEFRKDASSNFRTVYRLDSMKDAPVPSRVHPEITVQSKEDGRTSDFMLNISIGVDTFNQIAKYHEGTRENCKEMAEKYDWSEKRLQENLKRVDSSEQQTKASIEILNRFANAFSDIDEKGIKISGITDGYVKLNKKNMRKAKKALKRAFKKGEKP